MSKKVNQCCSYIAQRRKKIIIITFVLISLITGLRILPNHDIGGYALPSSPSVSWSTDSNNQPDFSNDDSWNESYLWAKYSSKRICNLDLAETNPYELNGSRYSAVGSTMSTAPQLLATCILPVPQKSFVLVMMNFLLAGLGMSLIIKYFFNKVPKWFGYSFALTGPMAIYIAWPHSTSFAWVPLCVLFAGLQIKNNFALRYTLLSCIFQICLLLSGQPEITIFGFLVLYVSQILIFQLYKGTLKENCIRLIKLISTSFLAALISSFALLPVGVNALNSGAAESRGLVNWVNFNQEWHSIKVNFKYIFYQFIDPALHSNANTYRTIISPLPFSRLTAWVGLISISLIISTLIFVNRKIDSKTEIYVSFIRWLSLFSSLTFFVSLRTPWSEALMSRLPIISSMDRNLVRYLTVIFIFFAVLSCLQIINKNICISTFIIFVVSRIVVFFYLYIKRSDLEHDTAAIRKNLSITYNSIIFQRWYIVISTILIVLFMFFGIKKWHLKTFRVILAGVIFFELFQIILIKPVNFVKVKPSNTAKQVSNIINGSHKRFIAPASYFATIGTWLEAPSTSGYSLISQNQQEAIEDLASCKINNPYIYMPCGYSEEDANFYDISNVGWVINPSNLDNIDEKYHDNLTPVLELKNGFTLFRREGNTSAAFSVDKKYCDENTVVNNISEVKLNKVNSVLTYGKDPDNISIISESGLSECTVVSLAYDEGYKVKGSPKIKSLSGFLLIDTANYASNVIEIEHITPKRNIGYVITLFGLIILACYAFICKRKSILLAIKNNSPNRVTNVR